MTAIGIALSIVGAVMVAAGVAVCITIARLPKFAPIPGWQGPTYLSYSPNVDGRAVAHALGLAVDSLCQASAIPEADVRAAVARVSVVVKDVDVWTNRLGQKVAGEESNFAVVVGPKLEALCHELTHAVERYVDGQTDNAHARWAERDFWKVDAVYRAALAR